MPDKTIDNNKIYIQNKQYAIDAGIVDRYLIKNPNSRKINLTYCMIKSITEEIKNL